MTKTATLDDAIRLAAEKFTGVVDSDGQPYILHCLRVMLGVTDLVTKQVAVLHDLVEDTEITLEQLVAMGFAADVVEAIGLMTHRDDEKYANYVVRLKNNAMARQVKLADLHDNYSLTRVKYREFKVETDIRRIQKYILSYQFLIDKIDESAYLGQMQEIE